MGIRLCLAPVLASAAALAGGVAAPSALGVAGPAPVASPPVPPTTTPAPAPQPVRLTLPAAPRSFSRYDPDVPPPRRPPRPPVLTRPLKLRDSGPDVTQLQTWLASRGFDVDVTGTFDSATRHAVVGVQKLAGQPRTGVADGSTTSAMNMGLPLGLRFAEPNRVEVDLVRQVAIVVLGGRVKLISPVSSGTGRHYSGSYKGVPYHGVAVTPKGHYTIYRKLPAWRRSKLGLLYKPMYITGGIALHGSPSVPPRPASHGCIRFPIRTIERLYPLLGIGTPVHVY